MQSSSPALTSLTVRTTDLHSHQHYVGKLSLVDLAGSERLSKSQTTGQAAKESMAINRSLSYLEQCVVALSKRQAGGHVPYRSSTLTHVLPAVLVLCWRRLRRRRAIHRCACVRAQVSPPALSPGAPEWRRSEDRWRPRWQYAYVPG